MGRLLLAFLVSLAPTHFLFANVSISEVAWMGSSESANHEWIELYNSGESVSVEGWVLSDGGNLAITLVGTIPAGTYAVLERNRGDGGSVVGTPLINYSGALVNTGATLTVRRADGSVVDSVAGGENWQNIGGDNTTKDTAQYTTNGWITASPTPGRANATVASPPVASTNSSSSSGNRTILYGVAATTAVTSSIPSDTLSLRLTAPPLVYVGQPVSFRVTPSGMTQTIRSSLKYQWNFGDLNTSTSSSPDHTFSYPGTYNVFVEGEFASYKATARLEIAVLPMTVSLSHSQKGDILLHNDALYEVDLSRHYLTSSKTKMIPNHTYLSPRQTITIAWGAVGSSPFPPVFLLGREREVITSTYALAKTEAKAATIPVSGSVSEREVLERGSEVSAIPSAFGFVSERTTVAEDDFAESEKAIEVTEEDGTYSVTPLLALTSASTTQPSSGATWWTYGLLILVLVGAVASLTARPKLIKQTE